MDHKLSNPFPKTPHPPRFTRSPPGLMTVSVMATQGEVDSLLNASLDTQPAPAPLPPPASASVSSPPSISPPPTLVAITNIPPPQPAQPMKPQEFAGKPPAPPPPAISPHPPPLPPPPSSYSIMLSAAAAANNNAQDLSKPGLDRWIRSHLMRHRVFHTEYRQCRLFTFRCLLASL